MAVDPFPAMWLLLDDLTSYLIPLYIVFLKRLNNKLAQRHLHLISRKQNAHEK